MANRFSYYAFCALALLLAGDVLVNAEVYVCGIDYDDAAANCVINTACPNGEGCFSEQTCFAIPEDRCVGMTASPSPTSRPDLYVCGISFEDAISRCRSEEDACTDVTDTTAYCAVGDADVARSCFVIPHESCFAGAPSSSPVPTTTSPTAASVEVSNAASTGPTVSLSPTSKAPTAATISPTATTALMVTSAAPATSLLTVSLAPTVLTNSPTPEMLFVCGVDYFDASNNHCALTACPDGDGCDEGLTCFAVPFAACVPSNSPIALGSAISVCGIDYSDASMNYCTNPSCPLGDECEMGHACFSIPYAGCDEDLASISPASPSTVAAAFDATISPASPVPDAPTTSPNSTSPMTIAPSKSPVYNIYFCGETYEVAEANCWTAEACPSGICSNAGEQCFGISVERCLSSAPTDAPTVAGPRPSASPTVSPSPTASPSTSPVPTVEVANTLFCGVDYDDAMSSCSEATGCPSGAGCPNGMNCFSGISCAALLPPSSAPPTVFATGGTDAALSSASPVPATPTISLNSTSPTMIAPSKSPVYNIFFCGETYEVAEANCWTAEACPSGTCSNAGEQCFGISVERCLSSAPTDAPTIAGPRPSASPTASTSPTASPSRYSSSVPTKPVVNTLFCGMDYDDAMSSCSEATGCPSGGGCPNGMNCFTGISCAALLPPSSAPPTTFWNTLIGAPGVTQPPVPLIQKYCGADLKDATNLCADKMPCHDGNTLVCPFGETCFEIAGQCGEVEGVSASTATGSRQPMNPAAGSTQPSALIPAASTPSLSPMGGVFDLNNRCGDNYEDAFMNCRDRLACALGATGECPNGQTCYPVVICETPPPSPTAGMNKMDTSKPPVGGSVTAKPAWEWDLNAVTKNSGSVKLFTKHMFLGGATLLVLF